MTPTRTLWGALVAASAIAHPAAAQRSDVIHGRVSGDSGVAIPKADVIVTMAPTAETFTTSTDASGAYRIEIPNGTGEYLLYVGAVGRKPVRQRVVRRDAEHDFTVDVTLIVAVQQLTAVRVQATRSRPMRALGAESTIGTDGTDRTVDGVSGALSPELQGNIDAMAALIPGLNITPGGTSAFGLGSESNLRSLNGLAFPGAELPRDVSSTTRFTTSPWDPSKGGAAGVFASTTLSRGSNVARRRGHVTGDAPPLQFGDRTAQQFGQEYSNLVLSAGGDGPLALDEYFYNYGLQVSRRQSEPSTLLALDGDALLHAGVSADSARRLLQTLAALHVPVSVAGIPATRVATTMSFVERVDHAVPTVPQGSVPKPSWWASAYGQYSRSDAASLSPTTLPSVTGTRTNALAAVQGLYSAYLGKDGDYINETTTALTFSDSRGAPYLSMPSGNVLIVSSLSDGAQGIASLPFGGNSALSTNRRAWSWEAVNQTGFLLNGIQQRPFKLYLQSRLDGFQQEPSADRLGTYSFASLEDLAAQRPSAYSRTLSAPNQRGGEWFGAAALGGGWTTGRVDWTGGARVDANVFTSGPANNAAVEKLFAVRTDQVPNTLALSPRLGFKWYYTPARGGIMANSSSVSSLYRSGPLIRGGIGEFRDYLPSSLLSEAIGSTGLSDATQRLLCIGAAAPVPDWEGYANDPSSIPRTCAGGAPSFSDASPAVTLFDRHYTALTSRRATLGWTNTIKEMYVAIDATYSQALNQPGTLDLNFSGTPRLTLANEGNRPVFVSASSIVPSTGAVSSTESRQSAAYGRVNDRVSDLRGTTRQVSVYAIPNIPYRFGVLTVGYTYALGESQGRGFDQSSAGDPRVIDWAATSFLPHHQVVIQGAHSFGNVGITTFVRATSGVPFTPLVAGDINGDGSSFNDRAFVFNPNTTSDANVASGLTTLLRNGPSAARDCLSRQLGQIAARNSCTGDWSASMTSSLFFFPAIPRTDDRAKVSLSFSNPLGGIDQLLHGGANLRGWGAQAFPDQTLYQVRGFDAANQRFVYQVNPRFGSSSAATSVIRNPFRITLDVSLDLGHSVREQSLALLLRMRPPLVGSRAPADSIRQRYMRATSANGFMDIYGLLLTSFADSLALSREQVQRMQSQRVVLRAKADSIFGTLAVYLAALPPSYDPKEAVARETSAASDVWAAVYAEKTFLLELLTPGQIRRLPGSLFQMVTVPGYSGRFMYMF